MPDPLPSLQPAELARYSRHLLLGEIGLEGQRRLAAARVLVIGAGGLGSPAALYLAAAGVGTLGIADFDRVEEHNLQRQILHDTASVGEPKVRSAARRLRAANPFIQVVEHGEGVTAANAVALFSSYDVIVDGTDSFPTRYLDNDAAALAGRPLVYGSLFKFEGQVTIFDPAHGGPCHRCLFPTPPPAGSVPNCGDAGVLGALGGVIGSLQAIEAIKLIVGFGEPLRGRLLLYDALPQDFRTLRISRDPACPVCGDHPTLRALREEDYRFDACPPSPASAKTEPMNYPLEMSVTEARQALDAAPGETALVDVREPYEVEICRVAGALFIPMRQIPAHLGTLPRDKHLLVLCHHGSRSMNVTQYLRANGYSAVTNIAGGIAAWADQLEPAMQRY